MAQQALETSAIESESEVDTSGKRRRRPVQPFTGSSDSDSDVEKSPRKKTPVKRKNTVTCAAENSGPVRAVVESSPNSSTGW